MEYIYTAMLIHKAGKKIEETSVTKVLEAAGIKPDIARIKALVSALAEIDIEKAIKEAAIPITIAAPTTSEPVKETKKEEKKTDDSQAAAGLGALFG